MRLGRSQGRSWRRLAALALVVAACVGTLARADELDDDGASAGGGRRLASVNGESITFDDFLRALSEVHTGDGGDEVGPSLKDPAKLLERLIKAKLVAQEARAIGFDARPDFQDELAAFGRKTLIDLTLRRRAEQVEAPGAEQVEQRYRIANGEVKLDGLGFEDAADAEACLAMLALGEPFEKVVETFVADGRARGGLGDEFTRLDELAPGLAREILALEPGEISSSIVMEGGFAVVRLVDLVIPEDESARALAERESLEFERLKAISRYVGELQDRYASVNEELLEETDFNVVDEELAALRADRRTVVAIEGGEPIAVADLAAATGSKFFHGIERAAEEGKVNERKYDVLHDMIVKRVVPIEGARLGIERSEEYRAIVRVHEEERLFNAAMRSVVWPEVRVDESDVARYYEKHMNEYPGPELVRLESMAFVERAAAEQALDRLRRGADWQWTIEHAAGQVEGEAREGLIEFRALRAVEMLPQPVQDELRGLEAGAYLLHAPQDGPAYVLSVVAKPARVPLELKEVRGAITAKLSEERAGVALDAWVAELREASEVEILVRAQELSALVDAERGVRQ